MNVSWYFEIHPVKRYNISSFLFCFNFVMRNTNVDKKKLQKAKYIFYSLHSFLITVPIVVLLLQCVL